MILAGLMLFLELLVFMLILLPAVTIVLPFALARKAINS